MKKRIHPRLTQKTSLMTIADLYIVEMAYAVAVIKIFGYLIRHFKPVLLIYILYTSEYRQRVIHPSLSHTWTDYTVIHPTTQSSGWYYRRSGRKVSTHRVWNVLGRRGPLGHFRNSGDILFHFCRITPPTASERGNTFSMSKFADQSILHIVFRHNYSVLAPCLPMQVVGADGLSSPLWYNDHCRGRTPIYYTHDYHKNVEKVNV